MLRDQISELKLQLIEKNAECDHLMLEIEAKTQSHLRSLQEVAQTNDKQEGKLKKYIAELKEVGSSLTTRAIASL
jgi:hypothetical protein